MKKQNILFIFLLFPVILSAQSEKLEKETNGAADQMFNIILSNDFENNTPGQYQYAEWLRDFNNPPWANRLSRALIYPKDDGQCLKIEFDEGTVSLNEDDMENPGGGIQFNAPLNADHYEELYLTYKVMFKPGFDFVLSGKLPGMMGGPNDYVAGTQPSWDQGFSCGLAWSGVLSGDPTIATIGFYLYYQDMPGDYGRIYSWADPYSEDPYFKIITTPEQWYTISLRIAMNSCNGPGEEGNRDGLLEGYINGKLVSQWTGIRFRNVETIGIDLLKLYTFFGGEGPDFACRRDEWLLFDDIYIYTYADGVDVPRGTTPSVWNRELILPGSDAGTVPVDPPPPPPFSDNVDPSVPQNLFASSVGDTSFDVDWSPSTDNVGVTGYLVYIDGQLVKTTPTTTFHRAGLTPEQTSKVEVSAIDAAGNESAKCSSILVTTVGGDVTPPSVPNGLTVTGTTDNFANLTWTPSTDNVSVAGYHCFLDDQLVGSSVANKFTFWGLIANTSYSLSIAARDPAGNESARSTPLQITTPLPDHIPPTVPSGLVALTLGETFANISWTASKDDNGLAGYTIYANDIDKGIAITNSFTLTGLKPGISYTVRVSAYDLSSNESERSEALVITTKKPPDDLSAPTLPDVEIDTLIKGDRSIDLYSVLSSVGHIEIEDFGALISKDPKGVIGGRIIYSSPDLTEVLSKGRIDKNLQLLYNFSEGTGDLVRDRSGNLKPLDLGISNILNTRWLPGQGLRIYSNATIQSDGVPSDLLSALQTTNEMTFEAWVKSSGVSQSGPARIISLSSGIFNRAFTLGQAGNLSNYDYNIRTSTSMTDENGVPEVSSSVGFTTLDLHHILYTRDRGGKEVLYLNSSVVYEGMRTGDFSTWEDDYLFLLGNEASGDRPWAGIYYMAAVYNRALTAQEVMQNYGAGLGEIQYTTHLTGLEPNIPYYVAPFVRTAEGTVYGDVRKVMVENVLLPPEDKSLYVAVYPNPSGGDFNLFMKRQDLEISESFIRIADVSGHVLYHKDLQWPSEGEEQTIYLQLSGILPDGFYSLMLVTGGMKVAHKLVIQH